MADEVKKNSLKEGYTEFGGTTNRAGGWLYPVGVAGRFFAKFFARKAQPVIVNQDKLPAPTNAGDTIVNTELIRPDSNPVLGRINRNTPIFPPLEANRKFRYKEYEEMDEYPEIGSAFDIYADDCSQKDLKGALWSVLTDDQLAKEEIENLFKVIKLDRFYWDIIRNTVKYGDCFIEIVIDLEAPKQGLRKIKILNPNYIYRVENEYGYLEGYYQEIPSKNNWDTFGYQNDFVQGKKFIELDREQIVHFRLHTSDPLYYPYGKSVASLCRSIFRSLKIMEDAMLIYRLSRAPERRIFYIDVGNLPATKAESFIERLKEKFKKEKIYDRGTSQINENYNPMSADEDFFVPTRGGNSGTKIETLPGAENLGEVDDVKYFRDKLLAALKIPKDYIVEKDKSPERKANLAQLDVKFARTITRIQKSIEIGLENVAKKHLAIKGFPRKTIDDLRIRLPDPSDMMTKRKLDVDEQKARVIQAVQMLQLFPKETIYKEYYDLTDIEIEEIEKKLEKDMEKMAKKASAGGMAPGMPGAPGMPPPPGMGPPGPTGMAGPEPTEAGGQESDENSPPTAKKEGFTTNFLKHRLLKENLDPRKVRILTRALNRGKNKE